MFRQVLSGFTLSLFFTFVFLTCFGVPFLWFGQSFEAKYFPVLDHVQVEQIGTRKRGSEQHYVWYSVEGDLVNDRCVLQDLIKWTLVYTDGEQIDVHARLIRSTVDIDGRLTQLYRLGIDQIDDIEDVFSQKLTIVHDCHPLWKSHTVINIAGIK